jgi:hypothetical protein
MLSAFRFFCSGVSSFWNLRSYRESNRGKSRNRQTESSCREGAMKKALLYSLFVLVFISGCGANSAPIAVTLSTGATQALDQGQSVAITATVANDSAAKGVTWSLAGGGQGAIANQTTTAVTYNAGTASGTAVITATSVTDTTKISTLTITVTAPPAITTTTLQAGVEGTAYSQAIMKTGGAGTVTFSISAGTLPAGLTLSSAGTISGTPTGPSGTASFTVKVTDSSTMTPMTATQALSILVNLPAAPTITTTTLPAGVEGTAYSQMVAATGFGTLTFTTSAGAVPAGLALSSAGLISGTPTGPNVTANFTVMVTDSSNPTQTATQALSIAINLPAPPSITTTTLAAGVEGTAYSQPVVATGGLGALTLTISAGSLPAGLSMSAAGVITGTPTGPNGTANFTVMVTDHSNPAQSATKPLSILINLPPAPSISPTTLPGGNVGTPYTHALAVTGGLGPFTWSVSSGTLPAGLSFDATTATISGIPTTQQVNVAFTIQVTDSSNPQQSGSQPYTVTIGAPLPLSITTTSPLPQGNLNVVYSATISATGGIAPYTFSLDGTSSPLPASLGFSSGSNQGLISGTPTAVGTFTNIIVDVHDSQGTPATAQQTFTLTVLAPPSITSLSLASGQVGTPITITGTNFGTTQGSSTVTFNGVSAGTATNWSSTSITVPVPAGATTGNVVVTVLSVASNGSTFTVTPSCTTNCSLSGTVTGPWVANVTISLTGAASVSATTAANGTYSFANLAAGSYTITPTLAGYTYTPTPPTIAISSNTVQDFVATSAMPSFSISGTVSGNTTSGIVYIRVTNCGGGTNCNTTAGTTLASVTTNGGSYTVRGLSNGNNYTVSAEIDTQNTGAPNESNPAGSISGISINSANVTGANIIISNRSPVTAVTPNKPSVSPSSGAAFISYKQPMDNNGEEIATSYKLYYDTNNSFTNNTFKIVPSGNAENVFVLSGLTDGSSYYFKMTAVNAIGESTSPTPTVVGPVLIGATTGSNTVSGTVTIAGLTPPAGSALYVGMFSNNGVYFERIANPSISQPYSVSGITNGTYQEFAVLNVTGTDFLGVDEITNFGSNGPPSLAVNTSISGNNITLTAVSAKTFVGTSHQRFASPPPTPDSYSIGLSTYVGTKRPVSMTLLSGNNVAVPFDMTAERHNQYNPIFNNTVRPLSTDTYQFLVTFSDGTTQVLSNTGLTVLDSFAQNLAMNTPVNSTSLTPLTVPMLNWSAPASPPAFYNYSVGLSNANNAQENWNYNGGNNSNGIPSTQLNVMFNVDGSANPSPSLTTGTMYNWWVQVRDDNGNQAQFQTTYIP